MVGRRQLREKLLKVLYAYEKNPLDKKVAYSNLLESLEKIYDLYIYQLNLLLAIKKEAVEKIEFSKVKRLKLDEDLNPNKKFIENEIFKKLEQNKALNTYTDKHLNLTWSKDNQYPLSIFKKLKDSELYKKYMAENSNDFNEDKTFIIRVFDKFIAKNENLIDWYEEFNMAWADDFHIANSMTLKTLKFIDKNKPFNSLIQVFKGEEDKEFISNLYYKTIDNTQELNKTIESKLVNWELSRIAHIDKLILQMAFSELIYMPEIPPKVVINEYIELAKTFSTPSSNVFINGILDNYIKQNQP